MSSIPSTLIPAEEPLLPISDSDELVEMLAVLMIDMAGALSPPVLRPRQSKVSRAFSVWSVGL